MMSGIMCKPACVAVALIVFTVLASRSLALMQREESVRRCYSCGPLPHNISSDSWKECTGSQHALDAELCPQHRTHCATSVSLSQSITSLGCTEELGAPCLLTYSHQKQSHQITCTCNTDLCNRLFTAELLGQLRKYVTNSTEKDDEDYFNNFIKTTKFINISEVDLYDAITINKTIKTGTTVEPLKAVVPDRVRHDNEVDLPRVEALKQGVSPLDDDEDESEGSGSYEESRGHKRPSSAPSAPSSYLPSNDVHGWSSAPKMKLNLFVTALLTYNLI